MIYYYYYYYYVNIIFTYFLRNETLFNSAFQSILFCLDMGTLNVLQKEFPSNKERTIWTKSGDQGNAWFLAEVDTSVGYQHRFTFEGIDMASFTSDIALDDIGYAEYRCGYVRKCILHSV